MRFLCMRAWSFFSHYDFICGRERSDCIMYIHSYQFFGFYVSHEFFEDFKKLKMFASQTLINFMNMAFFELFVLRKNCDMKLRIEFRDQIVRSNSNYLDYDKMVTLTETIRRCVNTYRDGILEQIWGYV